MDNLKNNTYHVVLSYEKLQEDDRKEHDVWKIGLADKIRIVFVMLIALAIPITTVCLISKEVLQRAYNTVKIDCDSH
jgi:hypothetical protein